MFCEHNVVKNACFDCLRTENAKLKGELKEASEYADMQRLHKLQARAALGRWEEGARLKVKSDEDFRRRVDIVFGRASAAAKGDG